MLAFSSFFVLVASFSRTTIKPGLFMLLGISLSLAVQAQDDDDDFFIFDEEEEPVAEIADPLESINRVTFALNDKLYRGFLKPVARGLRVVPEPARVTVSNVFSNLGTPLSAFNALLQLDLANASTELTRFAVNTTLGVAGLFDPATAMGIRQDSEDLGQTLGRWGVGHGIFIVIPFLGASSIRDGIGSAGDTALNPVFQQLQPGELMGYRFTEAEIALSLDQDSYEAFYGSALDPYLFFRSAYVQNRAGRVEQ